MTIDALPLTAQQHTDLDVARSLATAGIPLFIAAPDPTTKTGFRPPTRWERTVADPTVVDRWRPGLALCAVMGCRLDLVDIDPRNGGDLATLNGITPRVYGIAATPSGGTHLFIASIGSGSRDNVYPGVDVKSGLPDGTGRGFAFLAPTVRTSVVTGEPIAYRWLQPPDPATLDPTDTSGAALAARIRELRAAGSGMRTIGGPDWWQTFITSREPQSAPAAERAITAKLTEVSGWTPDCGAGFRTTLLRAALTLGGYVGGGFLDEHEARTRLYAAVAQVWGTPDADDLLWIQQGLDDGTVQPFHVYTEQQERQHCEAARAVAAQGEQPPAAPDDDDGPPEPPWTVYTVLDGGQPFDPTGDGTDQGLAKAVAYRMYPALRYVTDTGTWIKRGRDVWTEHADDLSDWIVSVMAELMPLGATPVPKEASERTEGHWQAVRRAQFMSSAGSGRIARKLRAVVRSDHPASLHSAALDSNPEVLWAGAVPWDLRASIDLPVPARWVDPATPHLRSALCAPDPTVPTSRWDAFLAVVLPDPQVRAWALRVLSVALTGYPDAALPMLWGRERSGKTSLVEMLVTVLGSYAHAANPKLLNPQDNTHDAIVYDLKGRRLSFIDEGPKRGHEATERLKQLTGGGSLTARAMRANPITFQPTHTLVMTTNNEPHLTDPALRARLRLIPCDADEADVRPVRLPLLGQGLITEAPGILAALMREAAAYLADRDTASTAAAPAAIRDLAQRVADGQDPVREWVEGCTVPADPGTPGRTLYTTFARWYQDNPIYRRMAVPSEAAFGRTLTEMGFASVKIGGKWHRPLSVLSGPAGVAPWEPVPDVHMTRGPAPPRAEAGRGAPTGPVPGGLLAGSGGFAAEAARPSNASSTPVFTPSLAGMAGFSSISTKQQQEKIEKNTEKKAPPTRQPGNPPSNQGHDQAKQGLAGYLGETRQAPATDVDLSSGPRRPDRSQTVTEAPAARRPVDANTTKAEARRQLKAEQRAAAIREAAGEPITLPALVARTGEPTPLDSAAAGRVLAAAIERSGALTVDVETTGYPVSHRHYALRTIQLGDDHAAVVFDAADPAQAQIVAIALGAAPRLHAHSATADLVPLAYAGLIDAEVAWPKMFDTVIPAKLADPASTGSDPGLKKLAHTVLGNHAVAPAADTARANLFNTGRWLTDTTMTTPIERSGWAQVDMNRTVMVRYGAADVLDTAALAQTLPPVEPALLHRERTAQRLTARVAHHGVRIDGEHVADLLTKHTAHRHAAAGRVRAFGVDNPGSDRQIATALTERGAALPRTKPSPRHPQGQPSVAEGALDPLLRSHSQGSAVYDLVRAVLDYRHHDTAITTFLEPYQQLVHHGDRRARPTIYTLAATTGRMSCVRPNLQQVPRQGGFRACITADPGHLLVSADFAGVELRVAAALSGDQNLYRIVLEGDANKKNDLHWRIAREVFGPDAAKEDRYATKRLVFGRLYGGGIPTLARQVGVAESVAASAVDVLDAMTPGLATWSHQLRQAVRAGRTQFPTYSGRTIHLPPAEPHKAINFAVQGTARELLVDALIRWADTRWGNAILLPVHDEIVTVIPEGDAADATAALVAVMETELFGVQIKAEASTPAFAWADSS
jgi:P4 family phage/plasmid primase-like protien